ncbi:hypothetical protein K435DRAFT_961640 [Dendrothele bispora CBS 962.96]|uniref:RlpA-like protein double-psi beta-barrel domain-containing protein n=1 Tax=Dendrothele bispora (strain CBS 962.96) TaxID=1314807 RepID=A0A4S8MPI1_DENBC|nr:hypothetical protein K435DRAFT_961640 [Dendrothele bispora CBS 962.96]
MFSLSLSLRLCLLVGLSTTSLLHAVNAHDLKAGHHRRGSNVVSPQPNHNSTAIERRGGDKRFSWYPTGLGACGGTNGPDDFIVALNTPQWDGGSHCYETITVTYQGKSAQAQIVDRCVECPFGALDFSHGLFAYLAGSPEQIGIVYGDWSYGAGQPAPSPDPTTTQHHTPDPTPTPDPSTSQPEPTPEPTTTSSRTRAATSSSAAPSTSSESTSSTVSSTSSASSATPSQSAAPEGPQLLQLFETALGQLGGVVLAGLSVQSE